METVDHISFEQDDLDNVLAWLTDKQIDNLPFGAIELDRTGRILRFNMTESQLTGRKPEAVIGRSFFNEIAPCCNRPEFRGVFDAGVRSGDLNAIFDYVFDYKMNPTRVRVHMKKALVGDTYWMFVKRL